MTGIGVMMESLLQRLRTGLKIMDLHVRGRIGSPFSPLSISRALTRAGARDGVFWSPGFMPPATACIPSVVTVHDLTHLHFYSRFHAAYYDWVLRPLYRKCSAIICVSEFTRQEFLSWSGCDADRVFTVYNGVSKSFRALQDEGCAMQEAGAQLPLRSPVPFPYVFYPGNRRPHKNLARLIRAYSVSSLPAEGVHLLFTGPEDPGLLRIAAKAGVSEMVQFTGHVGQDALVRLYQYALLVAFISLYEGFGLPILEGMASGVPVLTSNCSCMPEIAGGAARLVDPYSIEDIAAGLDRLAGDSRERDRLIGLGRARAVQLSWDGAASLTWDIITGVTGTL